MMNNIPIFNDFNNANEFLTKDALKIFKEKTNSKLLKLYQNLEFKYIEKLEKAWHDNYITIVKEKENEILLNMYGKQSEIFARRFECNYKGLTFEEACNVRRKIWKKDYKKVDLLYKAWEKSFALLGYERYKMHIMTRKIWKGDYNLKYNTFWELFEDKENRQDRWKNIK